MSISSWIMTLVMYPAMAAVVCGIIVTPLAVDEFHGPRGDFRPQKK